MAAWEGAPVTSDLVGRVGNLRADELVTINGFTMHKSVVPAFQKFAAAAKAAGFTLKSSGSYRPLAEQQKLWNQRMTTTPLPGRPSKQYQGKTWYLKPGMAQVATPGNSVHGAGMAFDLADAGNNPKFYAWAKANAPKYGFANTVASEAWHFAYQAPGGVAPVATTNTPKATPAPAPDQPARDYQAGYQAELGQQNAMTPSLLAYLRTLNNAMAQAEDTRSMAQGNAVANYASSAERINRASGDERKAITGNLVGRGMLRSGEANEDYAKQSANTLQRQGDLTRGFAQQSSGINLAFNQATETYRNQALERMAQSEESVATTKATNDAQQRQWDALTEFYKKQGTS